MTVQKQNTLFYSWNQEDLSENSVQLICKAQYILSQSIVKTVSRQPTPSENPKGKQQ